VVAVLAAALLGAVAAWTLAPRGDRVAAVELPRTSSAGSISPEPPASARSTQRPGSAPGSVRARPAGVQAVQRSVRATIAPERISAPRIGLSLPVRATGVDDQGLMALPDTAYAVGWYRFGRGPLDRRGATVIAGHVDTRAEGTGPLARLASLRAGDVLSVLVDGRERRYRVDRVERIAKSVLDLPALFAREGAARLHLITCGGEYVPDRGGYQDNVVVTARPI
jgi:LPXTG-site transpeptidase (sortase) family protein